jgi:Protein of unknown function (DUF669)
MARLTEVLNVNELPENTQSYDLVPPGDYIAEIKNAELKATQNGTGEYIKMRLDITGPTNAGRVVFTNLNIRNANQVAQNIARQQIHTIISSNGINELEDTDQLIGCVVGIKVKIREARDGYEAQNEVKAFKAVGEPRQAPETFERPSAASAASAKAAPPWKRVAAA